MAISIRTAKQADIDAMIAVDTTAGSDQARRSAIVSWVTGGNAFVADDGSSVVGYVVLEYTFFGEGFVAMLQVSPARRRQGVATNLLRHLEGICRTRKLFTSTNESNTPMQKLVVALGYEPSGVVYNLDEGDPELFFFKSMES